MKITQVAQGPGRILRVTLDEDPGDVLHRFMEVTTVRGPRGYAARVQEVEGCTVTLYGMPAEAAIYGDSVRFFA